MWHRSSLYTLVTLRLDIHDKTLSSSKDRHSVTLQVHYALTWWRTVLVFEHDDESGQRSGDRQRERILRGAALRAAGGTALEPQTAIAPRLCAPWCSPPSRR